MPLKKNTKKQENFKDGDQPTQTKDGAVVRNQIRTAKQKFATIRVYKKENKLGPLIACSSDNCSRFNIGQFFYFTGLG